MLAWFSANIGTIVVSVLLLVIVFFVIRGMISEKRKGQCSCGSCGGSCGSCGMAGACHRK